MKNILLALLLLTFAVTASAQNRVLVGVAGGQSFDNDNFGVLIGIEHPFYKNLEVDLLDTFSPLESHVNLGHGWENVADLNGIAWMPYTDFFSHNIGITGGAEYSNYNVKTVAKGADYAHGGLITRAMLAGVPVRVSLEYIRQIANGITYAGIESSHLQGAQIGMDSRIGCVGPMCFRMNERLAVGQVWTQGNPQCDGSLSVKTNLLPCPRAKAVGGSFEASFSMEFPRRKGTEYNVF